MTLPNLFPCPCDCGCGYHVQDGGLCAYCKRGEHDGASVPDRPSQEVERPAPPHGELLFRFKTPALTKQQRGMVDVCVEYAVTSLTDEEIASSVMLVPHNSVILWGWLGWKNDWEANISARPVVFELLKRWRSECRLINSLNRESVDPVDGPWRISDLRLPGDDAD